MYVNDKYANFLLKFNSVFWNTVIWYAENNYTKKLRNTHLLMYKRDQIGGPAGPVADHDRHRGAVGDVL